MNAWTTFCNLSLLNDSVQVTTLCSISVRGAPLGPFGGEVQAINIPTIFNFYFKEPKL